MPTTSSKGIVSVWLQQHKHQYQLDFLSTAQRTLLFEGVFILNQNAVWIYIDENNALNVKLYKPPITSSTLILHMKTSNGAFPLGISPTNWKHVLISWDVSGGSFLGGIYVNDILDTTVLTYTGPGTVCWSEATLHRLFAANYNAFAGIGSTLFNALLGQLYVNSQEYLDMSIVSNRRKFISASLGYVDLGVDGSIPTGNTPSYMFHGRDTNPSENILLNFRNNQGTDSTGFWFETNTTDGNYIRSSPHEIPGYV